MGKIIPDFPLGRDLAVNPFEEHDAGYQSWMFVYLSGRGFHSYLFPGLPVDKILEEAAKTISMGYTQLWILQWMAAVSPKLGTYKKHHCPPEDELKKERVLEGKSHIIIGEPGNYLGWAKSLPEARKAAKEIVRERRFRVAIGLLLADVTWH